MEQGNNNKKTNYNIFKVLKFERNESFHSRMIVAIASYNDNCRKLFFEMLENKIESDVDNKNNLNILYRKINDEDYKRWINCEHTLKDRNRDKEWGRADIWIGNKDKESSYRAIIENKIDANDKWHQLRRYYRYLNSKGRNNAGLFYLCLKPNKKRIKKIEASARKYNNESVNYETKYYILTYEYDIKEWLRKVLEIEGLEPEFEYAVKQYSEVIDSITK